MSLKFSDIVPKLTRGELQRREQEAAKAKNPEPAPAAEPEPEQPVLDPGEPVERETEIVSAAESEPEADAEVEAVDEPPLTPTPPVAFGDADTGRRFDLGEDAAQFAEDMLERAIGSEALGAPHADAVAPEPEPKPEASVPAVPASFGFDFDDDAPQSELAMAVSSALSDDPGPAISDDEDDGADEVEDEGEGGVPGPNWLDQPAGPDADTRAPIPTHATETVTRRDTPAPSPRPAPAPEPAAPAASPHDIANELMRAVDPGDTPPGGVPSEELERLLSGALEEGGGATTPAAQSAGDEPALDPSHVAPGDFRSLAAGLIAELEASLNPDGERAPEDSP